MVTVDKDKQAFVMEMMEIEKEMNMNAAQVRAYESEIFTLKRTVKKNELTLKEVEAVKEGRSIYVPLGKAQSSLQGFIVKTQAQIRKSLLDQNTKHEQEAKECEKSRQYYEEKRKEKEQMVKEGLDRLMKKQEPAKK